MSSTDDGRYYPLCHGVRPWSDDETIDVDVTAPELLQQAYRQLMERLERSEPFPKPKPIPMTKAEKRLADKIQKRIDPTHVDSDVVDILLRRLTKEPVPITVASAELFKIAKEQG